MRLQMIDREKRLSSRQREAFARHQPDEHTADEARARRRGDPVEIGDPQLRFLQGARDQMVDRLDMGARGDLRHHAAIGGMGGDLAHDLVAEDFAAPFRAQPNHRGGGFVASGLDAQNAHSRFQIPGWRAASVRDSAVL